MYFDKKYIWSIKVGPPCLPNNQNKLNNIGDKDYVCKIIYK